MWASAASETAQGVSVCSSVQFLKLQGRFAGVRSPDDELDPFVVGLF